MTRAFLLANVKRLMLAARHLMGLAAVAPFAVGCVFPQPTVIPPGVESPFTGYASALYGRDEMWLCRPDLPANPCAADLTATEIHSDGSRTVVPFVPAKDPAIDCFYLYPTVDNDPYPGNHTDFRDRAPMLRATLLQAARFQEVCRLFVPLYRQITASTYAAPAWSLNRRLDIAFSDVADAFAHYLGQHNHGRRVVILGHSQGASMAVRLLRRFFDRDPLLQPRLLAGFPVGGRVEVPPGALTGGTFSNLSLCSSPDEIGCVVAYRSYPEGADVTDDPHGPPEGLESGCVNPASITDNARAAFSRSFLPSHYGAERVVDTGPDVSTPFVLYRGVFTAQCVPGPGRYNHLAIAVAKEAAAISPIDLADPGYKNTLGLHRFELLLPQGDLIDLVAHKASLPVK